MKTTPASLEFSSTEKEIKALKRQKWDSAAQSEKEQAEITIIVTTECLGQGWGDAVKGWERGNKGKWVQGAAALDPGVGHLVVGPNKCHQPSETQFSCL